MRARFGGKLGGGLAFGGFFGGVWGGLDGFGGVWGGLYESQTECGGVQKVFRCPPGRHPFLQTLLKYLGNWEEPSTRASHGYLPACVPAWVPTHFLEDRGFFEHPYWKLVWRGAPGIS